MSLLSPVGSDLSQERQALLARRNSTHE